MTKAKKAAWHRNEAATSARRAAKICRLAGQIGNAEHFERVALAHERMADRLAK